MIASDVAASSAPPSPCSARARVKTRLVGAPPAAAEASAKGFQTEHERPSLPEHVGAAAGQHQEAREHDRVRVDHPLELRGGEAQAGLDRGQGDVDDRQVEDHHELRDAADPEQERLPRDPLQRPVARLGQFGRACAAQEAHALRFGSRPLEAQVPRGGAVLPRPRAPVNRPLSTRRSWFA